MRIHPVLWRLVLALSGFDIAPCLVHWLEIMMLTWLHRTNAALLVGPSDYEPWTLNMSY